MFFKPTILNKLMKQAFKSGLTVAKSEGYLYIAGKYWEVEIKEDFIPNKTKGDLIALIGEFPVDGERFTATKTEQQMENAMRKRIEDIVVSGELTKTNLILISEGGVPQRLMQDEETGMIYIINNAFIEIVDNSQIEVKKGECSATEIYYNRFDGIQIQNNACKLRAHFRADEGNANILEALKGEDITPEV